MKFSSIRHSKFRLGSLKLLMGELICSSILFFTFNRSLFSHITIFGLACQPVSLSTTYMGFSLQPAQSSKYNPCSFLGLLPSLKEKPIPCARVYFIKKPTYKGFQVGYFVTWARSTRILDYYSVGISLYPLQHNTMLPSSFFQLKAIYLLHQTKDDNAQNKTSCANTKSAVKSSDMGEVDTPSRLDSSATSLTLDFNHRSKIFIQPASSQDQPTDIQASRRGGIIEVDEVKEYAEHYKQRLQPKRRKQQLHHQCDQRIKQDIFQSRLVPLQLRMSAFPERLNYPFSTGETPLTFACEHSTVQTVALLLALGAQVNLPDARGEFALHKAIEQERVETVAYLLTHSKAKVDVLSPQSNAAIHLACGFKLAETVALLLPKTQLLNHLNQDGIAPIHIVSLSGSATLAKVLLSTPKLDLDLETAEGETALSLSLQRRFYWMTEQLLLRHAWPNQILPSKISLFEAIVSTGKSSLIKLLLENIFFDTNQTDGFERPLLHVCIDNNWKGLAKKLLELGADPKRSNAAGLNALQYSLLNKKKGIFLQLFLQRIKHAYRIRGRMHTFSLMRPWMG